MKDLQKNLQLTTINRKSLKKQAFTPVFLYTQ
jgi:hypothetical protein